MTKLIINFLCIAIVIMTSTSTGCNPEEKKFKLIKMDKSTIAFIDGDSFFYKDTPIRLLGVDTPEIICEKYGIYENQEMGPEAAGFTKTEILKANLVQYIPYEKDTYDRLLAHVFVDRKLLAVKLIKAGYAYENVSFYGDNGFKKIGMKILKASKRSPEPKFEKPHIWKKKHKK